MTDTTVRKSLAWVYDDVNFYPHQIEGIRRLCRMTSYLLADEMGLGKSVQALVTFAVDVEQGWGEKLLVVAPATLKGNWADEIEKFTRFPYVVLEGTPAKRSKQIAEFAEQVGPRVLIINYEQVKPHVVELNTIAFDKVIYDEAHYMKNPKSQRTKAAHALYAKRYALLTGSPMLNHVHELWSLLHRIAPAEYPSYYRFLNRYAVFGGYNDKQIVGVKNEKELTERLQAFMVRRLKKDVLDLPDKQRIVIKVDLRDEQRKLYEYIEEELSIPTAGYAPTPTEVENALTKYLRLKQVCGTTATIEGWEDRDHSGKLDALEGMVYELHENDHKVVIFTQFRGVLQAAVRRLEALGVPTYQLHGDVAPSARSGVVRAWSDDARPAALVCMLQVAGVGLNMTAARHLIFLDKLYVPKLNEQAEDRVHRIGADTTQPVQIFELIARRTIESRIERILRIKSKLFGEIVEQDDYKRALYEALTAADEEE
jgi:SNF2 family DNA or RNA helicase